MRNIFRYLVAHLREEYVGVQVLIYTLGADIRAIIIGSFKETLSKGARYTEPVLVAITEI
jgi:hypothetical protein